MSHRCLEMKSNSVFTNLPRPPPPSAFDHVDFQIIDTMMHDKGGDGDIVIFGVTDKGNSVSVVVSGYSHNFFIGCSLSADQVAQNMKEAASLFQLEELSGYRSVYMNHRPREHYYRVLCKDQHAFSKARAAFSQRPDTYALYNADIEERTRFLVDCRLVGCGWCRVSKFERVEKPTCQCQINIRAHYQSLQPLEITGNAPIRTLAFDIECTSLGGFPRAENDSDKVIDIGVTTQIQGSDEVENVVFVLHKTDSLLSGRLFEFEQEKDMLYGFFNYILQFDPDVISGYNVDNFDWPYLLQRAHKLQVNNDFSRAMEYAVKAVPKTFSSNQLGTRESYEITIPGRVSLDVLPQIQISYKLRSYSLNSVASEFLKMQKDDVHYSTITPLFYKGPDGRRIVAQYCLKDAQLPMLLLNKLMIIFQVFELSKVTGVILQVLVRQGQQVRMVSLLARHAMAAQLLIPTRRRAESSGAARMQDENPEELEGATVLAPVRGYYDEKSPISTLDFSSLYPSIIIAHNLCYSTLVEQRDFDIGYFNKQNGKNFSLSELLSSDYVTKTPQNFYFLNSRTRVGLLPQILRDLLAARKAAKKDMKNAKDALELNVLNGRQLALKTTANSLYGFTGALQTGKLPSIEISSSVTSFGRYMIELTKNTVEATYKYGKVFELEGTQIVLDADAKVIYGDTDSVMVYFGVHTLPESFLLARHAAEFVTRKFVEPINLEFEKVYCPYLLINKKRYAGLFWTRLDKYDKIDVKGLELVRRDNCQLVPIVMRRVLECLFLEHSPTLAVKYVKSVVRDLMMDRIDMSLLVISKAYSQAMDDYKNESLPHLSVAKKLMARGQTVNIGDRIQYVVLRANEKEIYKRAEDPQYAVQNNLPIDTDYYLLQQLQKPVARLLGPVLAPKLPPDAAEEEAARLLFTGQHALFSSVRMSQDALKGLRVKVQKKCLVCGATANEDVVCQACKRDVTRVQAKYSQLLNQLRMYEFRVCCIGAECNRCQTGVKDMEDGCVNKDCEVYFARMKQLMELNRVREQISQLQSIAPK